MERIKQLLQIATLLAGAVVTVATSREPDPEPYSYISEEWIVENLFDGQTAVDDDLQIRLKVGTLDFGSGGDGSADYRARSSLETVRLYPADNKDETVPFEIEVDAEDSLLIPDGLLPDTEYVLDLDALDDSLWSERFVPSPIHFRTGSLPRITGIWRNDRTLMIAFSEPMNSDDLFLGFGSVDVFWQDEEELLSIVSNLNLADFAVQVDDYLFMTAPIDFIDDGWLKVSGLVRGQSGVSLDGNANGETEGLGDDFIEAIHVDSLPECIAREDIPAPCIAETDLPEYWLTEEW